VLFPQLLGLSMGIAPGDLGLATPVLWLEEHE
jgi:heterodisulfide reductase subunit B